jgi:hypothetical protein
MVDVDQTEETQNHFKFVFAPGESIASKVFEKHLERFEKKVGNRAEVCVFRFSNTIARDQLASSNTTNGRKN